MAAEAALEKASPKTPAVITTPEEYRGALLRWQEQHFNVLTPFANMSSIASHHGMIATQVQLSVHPDDKDTYDNAGGRLAWLKNDEVAPAKNGLRKIEEALGISHRLEYISVGTIQNYWHVKAIGSYRGLDGSIQVREASQEWDLRPGSPRLKGWSEKQIEEGRKSGLRNCETRAINAMIRECGCGVKQSYKKVELAKAFVAVRVMFIPDLSDPEIKRQVTAAALAGTNTLYPGRALGSNVLASELDEPLADAEPRRVGSSSTAAPVEKSEPEPDPDGPPTPDAVRIVKVEAKQGETNGRKWTRYLVVDSTGLESSTFDQKLYDYAEKCRAGKLWVELTTEPNGKYTNLIEIAPAGQQPSLPDMENL